MMDKPRKKRKVGFVKRYTIQKEEHILNPEKRSSLLTEGKKNAKLRKLFKHKFEETFQSQPDKDVTF